MSNINLYNVDCLDFMKGVKDKAYDLAIVDPPYGIGDFWMKQRHTSSHGKKGWNELSPNKEYFDQLFRVSNNQIIFGANYYCHFLPIRNSWIVWDKGNDVEKMNTSECELAWTSFNIPMRIVFIQWSGGRKGEETGIKTIHPCQRPVRLHNWLLNNYANPGDQILDTYGGSMSIAIACYNLGFDLDLCELDPDYFKAGQARLDAHIAKYSPASEIPVTKKGEIKLF